MSDEQLDEHIEADVASLIKERYSSKELFFEANQHQTIKEVYKVLGDNYVGDPINSLIALERARDFSQHCEDTFKMALDTEFEEIDKQIAQWKVDWDKRAGYSPDTDRLFGLIEQQKELHIRTILELVRAYEVRTRAMNHLFKIVYSKNKNLSKLSQTLDTYTKMLEDQLRVVKKIRDSEMERSPEEQQRYIREEFERREQTIDDVSD